MTAPGRDAVRLEMTRSRKLKMKMQANPFLALKRRSLKIRGYLEVVAPDRVQGWIVADAEPESRRRLEIIVDGQKVDDIVASEYRGDLVAANIGVGDGCYAFCYRFQTVLRLEDHVIRVRDAATRFVLPRLKSERVRAGAKGSAIGGADSPPDSLEGAKAELASRETELAEAAQARDTIQAERDEFRRALDEAKAELASRETELAEAAQARDTIQAERDEFRTALDEAKAELASRETELVEAAQARDTIQAERDEFGAALDEAKAQLASRETELADVKVYREALETKAGTQGIRIAALQEQLATLESECLLLQEQVGGQQSAIEDQHCQLEDLARRSRAEAEAASTRLLSVESELAEAAQARDTIQSERDEFRTALDEAKAELASRGSELAEAAQARDTIQVERDEFRTALDQAKAELASRETQLAEAAQARDTIQAEREAITTRLAESEDKLKEAAKALHDICAERDVAQKKIPALERRISELEFRQGLGKQELHRSEGQIELIKDLLLRDGGL